MTLTHTDLTTRRCNLITRTARRAMGAIGIAAITTALSLTATAARAETTSAKTIPVQPAAAAWEQKLDGALRAMTETSPDVTQTVRVRIADVAAKDKAAHLAQWGFEIRQQSATSELVLRATAREAMVLAEDPEIAAISIERTAQAD
jgi:hypothetical protein